MPPQTGYVAGCLLITTHGVENSPANLPVFSLVFPDFLHACISLRCCRRSQDAGDPVFLYLGHFEFAWPYMSAPITLSETAAKNPAAL